MTTMAWMTLTNSTGMLVVRLSSMVPARSAPNTMPAKITPTGLSAARAAHGDAGEAVVAGKAVDQAAVHAQHMAEEPARPAMQPADAQGHDGDLGLADAGGLRRVGLRPTARIS